MTCIPTSFWSFSCKIKTTMSIKGDIYLTKVALVAIPGSELLTVFFVS